MPKKSKKRLRHRSNVTRKRGGSKQMEQIFLNFVKGIINDKNQDTGFIITKNYSEIIKIHNVKSTKYISKHLYKASHTQSASLRKQYKDWNTAIRAIKNHFGDGVKGVSKGATLNFINLDVRNNKLILTDKGKRFLETHLNKSKQPNIPYAPSASTPQNNLLSKLIPIPPYPNPNNELKICKDRLVAIMKENDFLKRENNALKKENDYWSQKYAEHEAEIMNLIDMMKTETDNKTALQKEVSYLNERNKELQDQLDFYSGSENILSLTQASKELIENEN